MLPCIAYLSESVSHFSDAVTSRVDIVDEKSNVSKALTSFFVSVVVLKVLVTLGSVVVGELQNGWEQQACLVHVRHVGGPQEKEGKVVKVAFLQQLHAHFLVKLQRLFRVLDTKHGLRKVHFVVNVGTFSPLDNLYPILVRIVHKSKTLHPSFVWFLLEGTTRFLEFFRNRIDIVDTWDVCEPELKNWQAKQGTLGCLTKTHLTAMCPNPSFSAFPAWYVESSSSVPWL